MAGAAPAAIPVVNVDNAIIAVAPAAPWALTWQDVMNLLKASLNPRFCSNLAAAQGYINAPPTGDALAFMGGFSSVVARACPAHTKKPEQKIFESMKPGVNHIVETYVDKYCMAPSAQSWLQLHTVLNGQLSPKYAALAFTAAERNAIVTEVQRQLEVFFEKLSLEQQVFLVFIRSFDMKTSGQDGYGGFGKMGSSSAVQANDVIRVICQSTGRAAPALPAAVGNTNIPTRLVWAYLQQANARAQVLTNAPNNYVP